MATLERQRQAGAAKIDNLATIALLTRYGVLDKDEGHIWFEAIQREPSLSGQKAIGNTLGPYMPLARRKQEASIAELERQLKKS